MDFRILVTGGAGYIGAHTVNHLIKRGVPSAHITVLDNLENGHIEFVPKGVRFEKIDLRNTVLLENLMETLQPDCIIHFAGYAYVGESMQNPLMYFKNNVLGGISLLSAMQKSKCKNIVFSSTCSVYGAIEQHLITERINPQPENPYAESKLIVEQMLNWLKRQGEINYVSLRYFNAAGADYGIGEWHEPETHLIPLVLSVGMGNAPKLSVFGNDYETPDGTCIRDYIHVTDLAEAHYLAIKYLYDKKQSLMVNLGTGIGSSVLEIVRQVEVISNTKIEVEFKPRRPGDVARLVADNSLAFHELGWCPMRDLSDIIKSAFKWQKEQRSIYGK
jgi:UDP-glucose 4-epimerase